MPVTNQKQITNNIELDEMTCYKPANLDIHFYIAPDKRGYPDIF